MNEREAILKQLDDILRRILPRLHDSADKAWQIPAYEQEAERLLALYLQMLKDQ